MMTLALLVTALIVVSALLISMVVVFIQVYFIEGTEVVGKDGNRWRKKYRFVFGEGGVYGLRSEYHLIRED